MCVLAKTTKKKKNSHRRDRVHYAVSDTTPTLLVGTQKEGVCALHVCRWSIAAGKRPVPFRTRKLSLHTLMVLQPGGCGRVSHRRHQTTTNNYISEQQRRRRSTTVSFSFTFFRNRHHTTVLRHTRPVALDPMELHTPAGEVAGNEP